MNGFFDNKKYNFNPFIGSGAIGIEFASFFQTLGAKVTVVEVLDRVLPVEDAEISAFALKQFQRQGMDIRLKAMVKGVKKGVSVIPLTVNKGSLPEEVC